MAERFIKFIPSEEALFLLKKKGHAFRLLTIIAESARRYEGSPDGLKKGEALIGGHEEYDMTESNYRSAKNILIRRSHIEIIETCRNRKKVTTGVTTVGTRVKLLTSTVYDINFEEGHDRNNDRLTTDSRPTHDELRKKRSISNDILNKENAQPAAQPRSKDSLSFNFDIWKFEGISQKDLAEWKLFYPHLDLQVEILKAAQWLKNNPSKSRKSLWRKYLTGWLGRTNESIENKKAYRSAASGTSFDRRTKDVNGNAVESTITGRF